MNIWHNEKRITVTNRVDKISKTHIVLKKGDLSGRAWLKTGRSGWHEYRTVTDALQSRQMLDATTPF